MANAIIKRKELGKEGVMAACTQLLDLYKIRTWRMNAGDQFGVNEATGKKWRKRGHAEGTPDLLAAPTMVCGTGMSPAGFHDLHTPIFLWVECKSSSGVQRPAQKEFQKAAEANGEVYLLVNDVAQLRDWLKGHGVIR